MIRAYYDTSFLLKLQFEEAGTEIVRAHAKKQFGLASACIARAEFASACHRKVREKQANSEQLSEMLGQFHDDIEAEIIEMLPLSDELFARVACAYADAPPTLFLRSLDALHLACAAENGFREVYSNDRRFLDAAPHFGLRGINLLEGA